MHSVLKILSEPTGSSVDLISLDDLKLALSITGTADDAALQAQITFQSRIIADYCYRRFAFAEVLETFTFDRYYGGSSYYYGGYYGGYYAGSREVLPPRNALVLKLFPVAEISEISQCGATNPNFDFDPESGRVWTTEGWWSDQVMVTYAGGYHLPDEAPALLQRACIEQVNSGRTSGTRDSTIREVQHGDRRVSYFTPTLASGSSGYLLPSTISLIDQYRRIEMV